MTPRNQLDNLIIRAMIDSDLPAVEALDKLSFSDPWPNGAFAYELKPGSPNICLVALKGSKEDTQDVIGVIVVWLIVDEAHIGTIAVHPDYRHLGVGRKLLAEALLQAAAHGAISSLLEVRAGNQAALALYYGLGYVAVGLRAGYYADNHKDALLLTWQTIDKAKLEALVR
jgi:ribosomal-protein-alanine N-acetyltransferase